MPACLHGARPARSFCHDCRIHVCWPSTAICSWTYTYSTVASSSCNSGSSRADKGPNRRTSLFLCRYSLPVPILIASSPIAVAVGEILFFFPLPLGMGRDEMERAVEKVTFASSQRGLPPVKSL